MVDACDSAAESPGCHDHDQDFGRVVGEDREHAVVTETSTIETTTDGANLLYQTSVGVAFSGYHVRLQTSTS